VIPPREVPNGRLPHTPAPDHKSTLTQPPLDTSRPFMDDTERIVARVQGREAWPREARRRLEAQRWPGLIDSVQVLVNATGASAGSG